ncbi:MAG: hypothetical protein ACE5O2_12570 [Armatimonadota bacterium]
MSYKRKCDVLLPIVGFLAICAGPAYAHKVKVFAAAEGRKISGYAYVPGGSRLRNVTIQVRGPRGEDLGKVKTDDKGEFSFEARLKTDHILVLETADGHSARFTVGSDELPDDLPSPAGTVAAPSGTATKSAAAPVQRRERAPPPTGIERQVADLGRQIRLLREEVDAYESRIRLHDILGGMGYILGIGGVAFFFLGARKRERQETSER